MNPERRDRVAHPENNKARLDTLEGKLNGLSTRFNEFVKKSLSPKEIASIRADVDSVRDVIANSQQMTQQQVALSQQLAALSQQQAAMRQQLESMPNRQQLQQIKNMVDRTQAAEEANSQRLQQQMESVAQRIQTSIQEDMTKMKALVERSLQALDQVQQRGDQTSRSVQDMKSLVDQAKNDADRAKKNAEKAEKLSSDAKRSIDDTTRETKEMVRDFKNFKQEASGAKGLAKENQAKMRELETKTRGLDKVDKVQVQVDSVQSDYFALKKKLMDSGVFKPPLPDEPEAQPVGTIELGEDIFSARLLYRLGVVKGKFDQRQEKLEALEADKKGSPRTPEITNGVYKAMQLQDVDSDEEDTLDLDESSIPEWDENVSGLEAPAIMPGDPGYNIVNHGVLAIVYATLLIQVCVTLLLVYFGFTTGQCYDPSKERPWMSIAILRFSRAAATATAGCIMGKDLMELANYIMTNLLLEPKPSFELVFISFCRVLVALLLGLANLVMFMGLLNPFDIWLNLTALGFVAEMGGQMLDVAKRGFFGKKIASMSTDTQFALFFMHDYPGWFDHFQLVTQALGVAFIIGCGIGMGFWPDMPTDHNGNCPLEDVGFTAWMVYLRHGHHHGGGEHGHHAAHSHHHG